MQREKIERLRTELKKLKETGCEECEKKKMREIKIATGSKATYLKHVASSATGAKSSGATGPTTKRTSATGAPAKSTSATGFATKAGADGNKILVKRCTCTMYCTPPNHAAPQPKNTKLRLQSTSLFSLPSMYTCVK